MSSNGKQKSFGIIGLGPVGTILGVHLQEAGYRVMVCDADRVKINQVRNEGVRLENVIVKQTRFRRSSIPQPN